LQLNAAILAATAPPPLRPFPRFESGLDDDLLPGPFVMAVATASVCTEAVPREERQRKTTLFIYRRLAGWFKGRPRAKYWPVAEYPQEGYAPLLRFNLRLKKQKLTLNYANFRQKNRIFIRIYRDGIKFFAYWCEKSF
jgi:hypothetical protein